MAKLGRYIISVDNPKYTQKKFEIEIDVQVSKDGLFYFSLNDEQVARIERIGVDLSSHRNKHSGKMGTFYAHSLAELKKDFQELLQDAVSVEVIEERKVILYDIQTWCSYWMDGGILVPCGLDAQDQVNKQEVAGCWVNGTKKGDDNNFGFSAWAQVYRKQVVRYKSGDVKTYYWAIGYEESDTLGQYGKLLNHFTLRAYDIKDATNNNSRWGLFCMGSKLEINYTEENAKFFYDLLISICLVNERIKDIIRDTPMLQKLIESQIKLLR